LKNVQKLIRSDQRSERSNACCHDGMCLWQYGAHTTSDTCRHGSWFTDDLNLYSISLVTCSRPSLQTWISWL